MSILEEYNEFICSYCLAIKNEKFCKVITSVLRLIYIYISREMQKNRNVYKYYSITLKQNLFKNKRLLKYRALYLSA